MIYGLYLSAQGAQIQTLRQAVVSNNIANAATTSFKRDLVTAQAHLPYDAEHGRPTWIQGNLYDMPGGVTPGISATDFSQGSIRHTNGTFDLAIQGKGFLRVTDGKKTYLTRDGELELGPQNQLVTRDGGLALLNSSGQPLGSIDPDLPVEILPNGSVTQGGDEVARLSLVEPQSYQEITKVGKNLYSASGKLNPVGPDTEVKQGYLENSGVQPVAGMMELIESSRVMEANVNMIHYQDDSLARLLGSLPRK
jgi:flagellar basal body rod protein FlgG